MCDETCTFGCNCYHERCIKTNVSSHVNTMVSLPLYLNIEHSTDKFLDNPR